MSSVEVVEKTRDRNDENDGTSPSCPSVDLVTIAVAIHHPKLSHIYNIITISYGLLPISVLNV